MADDPRVLVIGGGTAGTACARALARNGVSVVVAEPDRVGGTCLWRGCIPKKGLYQAAATHRMVRAAETFGTVPGDISLDWPGVLAWKWHAQETYAGDQESMLGDLGITLLRDQAHFVAPGRIAVGDRVLGPEYVVIATGSAPLGLSVSGGPLADSSDEALRYSALPRSLVIVGSGFVALEFAGIFASFGTAVTVLSRTDGFLDTFDQDCVAIVLAGLAELGVTLVTHASVTSISGVPGALKVTYADVDETEHTLESERVLAAIGRTPALESLELGVANIELDMRGRPVLDSSLRTTNRNIFVIGDAAGGLQHTPLASLHGRTIAASILGSHTLDPDTRAMPVACFTVPEIAQVGLTPAAATDAGIAFSVHTATFEYLGAAIVADTRHGLVKVLAREGSEEIIGAHVVGERASDLIYPLALALRLGAKLNDVRHSIGIHPSFAEVVNWSAS